MDEWRTFLYPLGFLSALIFGARFIVQWLESEKAKKSLVPRLFWQLSLIGNLLLILHTFIQLQYPVCLAQGCNAVISWRNLDFMQTKHAPVSFTRVIQLLIATIFFITLAFIVQDWLFMPIEGWLRVPTAPWQTSQYSVGFFWHILGTFAYFLFSSRFWIQWWFSEKAQASQLPVAFWWVSLVGSVLSIIYFMHIGDSVNLIGPLLGFIPYVRNLFLIQKASQTVEQE